jgi:hypothetical protein
LSEADFIFSLLSPERIKFSRAVSDSIRLDVEVFGLATSFGSALLAVLNLSRLFLKVELGWFSVKTSTGGDGSGSELRVSAGGVGGGGGKGGDGDNIGVCWFWNEGEDGSGIVGDLNGGLDASSFKLGNVKRRSLGVFEEVLLPLLLFKICDIGSRGDLRRSEPSWVGEMASLIIGVIKKWLLNNESDVYEEISSVVGVEMLVLLVTARSDLFAAAFAWFVLFGIALELDVELGWRELDDVSVVLDVDEDLGLLLSWLLASWSSGLMIGDGKQFEVSGVEADFGWSGLSLGSVLFSCVDWGVGCCEFLGLDFKNTSSSSSSSWSSNPSSLSFLFKLIFCPSTIKFLTLK